MSDQQGERREFQRVLFDSTVRLSEGGQAWECELLDISLKGVLLHEPDGWRGESGCTARLDLPLDGDEHIRMTVELVHRERGHLGFEWTDIDVDSFAHLRRLLELNLGDAELVNRELSALGGRL